MSNDKRITVCYEINSSLIDRRSSASSSWRKLFGWYVNFRFLVFPGFWIWNQCFPQVACLYLGYDSIWFFIKNMSSCMYLKSFPCGPIFGVYCCTNTKTALYFFSSWRIHQLGFETICWQCSSSGDIKTTSMKFSRRSRMFSAPWCNAGPQVPAKQLCIYCL